MPSKTFAGQYTSLAAIADFIAQAAQEANLNSKDMDFLKELIEADKVTPVIDEIYPLSEFREAFRYLDKGHARGKIVITVEHNNNT